MTDKSGGDPAIAELKTALREHLDQALPTAEERRADLARLSARARRGLAPSLRPGLAVAALAGVLGTAALGGAASMAQSGLWSTEQESWLVVAKAGAPRGVRYDGAGALFLRDVTLTVGGLASPSVGDEPLVSLSALNAPGFAVAADLVLLAGLAVEAEPCVNERTVDLGAQRVPLPVLVDAWANAAGLRADYQEGVLTLRCEGEPAGTLVRIDAQHPWPRREAALDLRVSIDVDGVPLDAVVAELARQASLRPGHYGASARPMVFLTLQGVRLETALAALTDATGIPVHLDAGEIVVIGPESPAVKNMGAYVTAMDARLEALRR